MARPDCGDLTCGVRPLGAAAASRPRVWRPGAVPLTRSGIVGPAPWQGTVSRWGLAVPSLRPLPPRPLVCSVGALDSRLDAYVAHSFLCSLLDKGFQSHTLFMPFLGGSVTNYDMGWGWMA